MPDTGLHNSGGWGTRKHSAPSDRDRPPARCDWQKLPFYAAHEIDEVLIVDPAEQKVSWLSLRDGEYRPVERSAFVALGATALAEQIRWP